MAGESNSWGEQFTTTFFRKGMETKEEIHEAILDRLYASGGSINDALHLLYLHTPDNYRDTHTFIHTVKHFVKWSLISSWNGKISDFYVMPQKPYYGDYQHIDNKEWFNGLGDTPDYLNYTSDKWVKITTSNILDIAKLPDNFFEYTPYRMLEGVPPNQGIVFDPELIEDDDYISDHDYDNPAQKRGYINSETLKGNLSGQDNYPKDYGKETNTSYVKDEWTTADYGFQGVYRILNCLVLTKPIVNKIYDPNTTISNYGYGKEGESTYDNSTSYSAAQTEAHTKYLASGYGSSINDLFQQGNIARTIDLDGYNPNPPYERKHLQWVYATQNSLTGKYQLTCNETIPPYATTDPNYDPVNPTKPNKKLNKKFVLIVAFPNAPAWMNDSETNDEYDGWQYDNQGGTNILDVATEYDYETDEHNPKFETRFGNDFSSLGNWPDLPIYNLDELPAGYNTKWWAKGWREDPSKMATWIEWKFEKRL